MESELLRREWIFQKFSLEFSHFFLCFKLYLKCENFMRFLANFGEICVFDINLEKSHSSLFELVHIEHFQHEKFPFFCMFPCDSLRDWNCSAVKCETSTFFLVHHLFFWFFRNFPWQTSADDFAKKKFIFFIFVCDSRESSNIHSLIKQNFYIKNCIHENLLCFTFFSQHTKKIKDKLKQIFVWENPRKIFYLQKRDENNTKFQPSKKK